MQPPSPARPAGLVCALLIASLAGVPSWGQDAGGEGGLTFDRLFAPDAFEAEEPDVSWHPDGESTLELEGSKAVAGGTDVVRYEAESGARSVVISARDLIPPGATEPLAIDGVALSDDGRRALVFTNAQRVWRRNTRGDYWVLELDSKELTRVGGGAPPASLLFAELSPDGTRVAYVHDHDLWVESLEDHSITLLTTDGSETVVNGTSDWVNEEELDIRDGFRWSPDGRRIAYWQFDFSEVGTFLLVDQTSGLYPEVKEFPYPKAGTTNSAVRIGVVDAAGGPTTWMDDVDDPRNHYLARLEWAASSDEIAIQHLNRHQNTLTVRRCEAATGECSRVLVERDPAWVDAVDEWRWLDDGQRLLWVSERDGWRHVWTVPREGGEATLLTPGDYDVVEVSGVDAAGGWLYFVATPDAPESRYLYRAALDGSGQVDRVTPEGASGYHLYDVAPSGRWASHTASSFGDPPVVELVSLPDHRSRRVIEDNQALRNALAALDRGEQRFFRIAIADGTELDGWEMRPPGFDAERSYPVLFYVYGEPWGQTVQDRWGGTRYLWHLLLTQRGYLVMSVDNRGTRAPRGREWRKSIFHRVGELNAADQAAAAEVIAGWDHVDGERLAIWGWSGGGSSTLNALFRYPGRWRVGMAVAPVPDQRLYDTIYQERYQGLPTEHPEVYEMGSPITFAHQLEDHLLVVHGTGDDNVHYQGTELLIDALVAAGKPFSMMAYPNRSHSIKEGEGTKRHLYELLARFLEAHLPAEPVGR